MDVKLNDVTVYINQTLNHRS